MSGLKGWECNTHTWGTKAHIVPSYLYYYFGPLGHHCQVCLSSLGVRVVQNYLQSGYIIECGCDHQG
jgi:hypothetical protein